MTTPSNEKIAIETKNLSKRFGNEIIISNLNLRVPFGKCIGVMGPSGTGKSVLLKCILGLTDYEGKIFYQGSLLDKQNRAMFYKNFGMLFQGSALFDSLTVWQNISFKLINSGKKFTRKEAIEAATLLLRDVGLDENVCQLMPSELSGGMQKRVALARALADQPGLLFFDEPTTGLDPLTSSSINELINKIVKKDNITSLIISHDPSSINKICDEVVFIENGKVGWKGKTVEMKFSKHELLKKYLSSYQN